MPFRKERALTPAEAGTKSFLFARDDVFERQTGIWPGACVFTVVPSKAYIARYGYEHGESRYWIWDNDQSKWFEGAAFDAGNENIIYPQENGTFVDLFGDPVEESLVRRDREPTERVVARLRKAMENPTVWEHLVFDDPLDPV